MNAAEQSKWDAYYDTLPLVEPDPLTESFNHEVAETIGALLPGEGRVLEAGCGAGWQGMAVARNERLDVTLLDFSTRALDYARRAFARAGVPARFVLGDASEPGAAEFDLVFNAGVLEHYAFDEQVRFVRSMASRTRRYVLALVPNHECYWYWLWRFHRTARETWHWGKEVPALDLSRVFEEAGLHFLGARHFGSTWTETFIAQLPGIDRDLAEELMEIHHSPVIPESQKAYLVAALGSVAAEPTPRGWGTPSRAEDPAVMELTAALSDALAMCVTVRRESAEREPKQAAALEEQRSLTARAESELSDLREATSARLDTLSRRLSKLREAHRTEREAGRAVAKEAGAVRACLRRFSEDYRSKLEEFRSQRAWQLMLSVRKAYSEWTRQGMAGKFRAMGTLARALSGSRAGLQEAELDFPEMGQYLPARAMEETAAAQAMAEQPAPLRPRKYDVVILPVFDFEFRFQRPQQIAAQFARSGHRVFWVSPTRFVDRTAGPPFRLSRARKNLWEVQVDGEIADLYGGALTEASCGRMLESLAALWREQGIVECCVLIQFPYWRRLGLALRDRFGAKLVYDMMDDWQNWPTEPFIGASNLADERSLVKETDVLVASSRRLSGRHAGNVPAPVLAPNAADFEFFSRPGGGGEESAGTRKPVIGYYGAIAPWFDVDLAALAARMRPDYSFVYVGQVSGVDVSELRSLKNVEMPGERDYRELPALLRGFDVCLIPFRLNQLTDGVDPVKVYEYLSQGKPVVATALPELEPHRRMLYLSRSREEFLEQLDRAVAERDPEAVAERIRFAAANTWQARAEAIGREVEATFPLVSILVVTYNSREFLRPFYDALSAHTSYPAYEVIFVDNASTDGSREILREIEQADQRVRVFWPERNLGFAGGNNEAARQARGEYLVFLNPDTLPAAGWLGRLLNVTRRDPTVGLVAPVTNFSGNETRIAAQYSNWTEMEEFAAFRARTHSGRTMEIDVAPLLCALVSKEVWLQVGELDERFEVGMFEDDDFSLRVKRAGYRIVTAEDCFLHHFGNGSFAKLASKESVRIFEANQRRFEEKWGRKWTTHRLRPGMQEAGDPPRQRLEAFLERPSDGGEEEPGPPVLLRLTPERVRAGVPFNAQPCGGWAMGIDCVGATPQTAIHLNGRALATTYGGPGWLTAVVPPDTLSRAGRYEVRLVNDDGESAALWLEVEGQAAARA